ncbi:MAG TPA: hypothetical protein VF200_15100 [Woeseiaceae bacterium]
MSRSLVWLLVLVILAPCPAAAAEGTVPASWPLFERDDLLEARIEAPLETLMDERDDTLYLPGTFSWVDATGARRALDLELRARGHYRRQEDICDVPPVRLNFRKKQVEGTEFAGQDKLKLVTHCQNRREQYEQYVLREYLAYKIFNVLTERSFRARLLRVTWVDTDGENETSTHYGILLEDDDRLAERLGVQVLEVPHTSVSDLDPAYAALVSVFQYMIGNTDYSLIRGEKDEDCCHNIVLLAQATGGHLAVPYDFDFSGLVDAPYAGPNPKLRIRRVTQRLYRGPCAYNEHVEAALAGARAHEADIMGLVASLDGLDDRSRERVSEFLGEFYEDTADAESVDDHIVSRCLSSG